MLRCIRLFTLLCASTLFCMNSACAHGLYSTKKAVEYFENKLEFNIGPGGLKGKMDEKHKMVIVDLRSEKDYKAGHIPEAINIPYDKYSAFDGKEKKFPGLIKDGMNIVYCYDELCDLGDRAARLFASLGYPVRKLNGGFDGWKRRSYAVSSESTTTATK